MNKVFRIFLVWVVILSSLATIGVFAAPGAPETPDAVTIYLPFINRPAQYLISGKVTNSNGSGISGVSVTDLHGAGAVTDANGNYSLASPPGTNALSASKTGYDFAPDVLELNITANTPSQNFSASAACIQGIVDPGFEVGGWWTLTGTSATHVATYNNLNRRSGSWSAFTGLAPATPNTYGYSWVRTPLISIPAGTTNAILRMWVYAETGESPLAPLPARPIANKLTLEEQTASIESGSAVATYDAQYVMVLDSGGAILEVLQWNRRNEQFWSPRQFDLTKWKGQSVAIEIGTYNDGQYATTSMYVDDVTFDMCDNPVPPTPVCSQQVSNNSFEFFGNWIDNSSLGFPYPSSFDTRYANSGFRSLRTGYPLEYFGNSAGYSEAYQVVTIPAGTTYARLSFYRLLISEETYIPAALTDARLNAEGVMQPPDNNNPQGLDIAQLHNDLQYAYVTNSAGTQLLRTLIYERGSNATNRLWKQNVYDLSALAGQTVRIIFGVYNDGGGAGRTAMYIDDVFLDTCTGVLPPPPPPSGLCYEEMGNNSFESSGAWYIPATVYSAGYTNLISRTGNRSMRTGIYYPSHNRYSYSDFGQYVYIPPFASAVLNYFEFTNGGDAGNDIQYLLVLDYWGNWIDTLSWQHRNDNYWRQRTFDLSMYDGLDFRLQWGTYNNGWGAVTSMTIDDVSLAVCP